MLDLNMAAAHTPVQLTGAVVAALRRTNPECSCQKEAPPTHSVASMLFELS